MSPAERLAALPEPVQRHLLGIARRAAGMSSDEKHAATVYFGTVSSHGAMTGPDELVYAADMVALLMRVVNEFDHLAGDQASGLVKR